MKLRKIKTAVRKKFPGVLRSKTPKAKAEGFRPRKGLKRKYRRPPARYPRAQACG